MKTKLTQLNKVDKYCIEQKFTEGVHGIPQIAEFVGATEDVIDKYLAKWSDYKEKDVKTPQQKKDVTNFIKSTAGKKNQGVSIMTRGESERGDAKSKVTGKRANTLHTIREDEE
jgi:hypothetical protein